MFDNDNVKYDIILGPGYKLSFQDWNQVELLWRKHGMVWLLHPSLSTWRFGFKWIQCHGRHVSHPSWRQALQWRLAQMLCNQDPGCRVWKDRCSWGRKRTHSSKCTSKKQIWFECYRITQRCLMELLAFIHIKRYTLTSTQMPSLCILGLIQYLKSMWRLSKWNSTIL